jgi:pimeloyl-ACP methyl ester carboxylesterase
MHPSKPYIETLMPDSNKSPKKPWSFRIARAGLVIFLALYASLSVFGSVAAMEIPRLPLKDSPSSVGLPYQNVSFGSRVENILLEGWYIAGSGERAIILVNGGFQNRNDDVVETLDLTRDLHLQGFDVLLFDLRGRGDSQGEARNLLNIDRDLGGAFDYVKNLGFEPSSIGILGFCSGAASACLFASKEPVGAVALDGCFASVTSMVYGQAAERHIPSFLVDIFLPGVRLAAFGFFGYREIDPIRVVGSVKAPIFFIHEQNDDLTGLKDTQNLLGNATNPADTLWEIPGALHSQGYRTDPAGFIERVSDFFNENLKARNS